MTKEYPEKDLFGQLGSEEAPPSAGESIKSIFRKRENPHVSVSMEQIFIALIVLLILFVLVFMMGVLRGKAIQRKTMPASVRTFETPAAPPSVTEAALSLRSAGQGPAPASNVQPKKPEQRAVVQAFANDPTKPYTIQLVTYRSEDRALKEISYLQAKGYVPRMITSGGYTVLCVGQYANRKEAEKDIKTLKARYKDCYLRKI